MANILVLEDSAALRRIVSRALRDEGHIVVESDNGLAAYDDDLLSSIDLMITDLVMPRIDGLEAIRAALETREDLKVIAMSGGSPAFQQDYLNVAGAFGADSVLHKPFEPGALVSVVNIALAAEAKRTKVSRPFDKNSEASRLAS